MSRFEIEISEAQPPFVVALDVGSSGSRGCVYDATGTPIAGRRLKVPHAFTTAADGAVTIDPDLVVAEIETLLDTIVGTDLVGSIGGVAIDTFASSVLGVDREGRAVTTCFTYADSRGADIVTELRNTLDADAVHERTGAFLHTSYLPARLRWWQANGGDPAKVARWMSLGEYIYLRLLGVTAVGTATASWTGMIDRRTGQWDPEMVAAAGISVDQLSEIRDPDEPLTDGAIDARRWPALADAAFYPVIADGLASNIGPVPPGASACVLGASTSGAMRVLLPQHPDRVPDGLWCYRVDRNRSLLGGAINDAGRVPAWLASILQLPEQDEIDRWCAQPPEAGTPLLLPFLTGERATGWRADARGVMAGLFAGHGVREIYRGSLEGLTQAYGRVARELFAAHPSIDQIVATGGMAQGLPAWLQMVADAFGTSVIPATFKRSTLRGTALLALEHAAPHVERSVPPIGERIEPRVEFREYYDTQAGEFDRLYRSLFER